MRGLPKGGFHVHAHIQGIAALVLETLLGGGISLLSKGYLVKLKISVQGIGSSSSTMSSDDTVKGITIKGSCCLVYLTDKNYDLLEETAEKSKSNDITRRQLYSVSLIRGFRRLRISYRMRPPQNRSISPIVSWHIVSTSSSGTGGSPSMLNSIAVVDGNVRV